MKNKDLIVKKVPGKGRGVFAGKNFRKSEIIERCPVLVIPEQERPHLNATGLHNYYFTWRREAVIALGLGSLYNHSFAPNARYLKVYSRSWIEIVAIRAIRKGEEITVNYNGRPNSQAPLWFKAQ
jgi:uncharacterized protein